MKEPKKRTEEEIVVQAGIEVVLGGEKYQIKPLVIKESRDWRKKLVNLLSELPKYAKVDTDTPEEFGEALNALMVDMPDTICDLFFAYAKDLSRQEIELKATEAEVAKAFEQVIEIAFPLVRSAGATIAKVSR